MEKDKALEIINQNKANALIYARPEEITAVAPQFEPIVTILQFKKTDFANVGGGNFYPMKSATNRIADAAGISFSENCGTREKGDYSTCPVTVAEDGSFFVSGSFAIIGFAQGSRVKPDGKPRTSSVCEYEFNICDRANLDFIADTKKPSKSYKTIADARKHVLELKKFSSSRASTGAELKVARELAGIPTAFKETECLKPLIFSQIVENNTWKIAIAQDIMRLPGGAQAMAAQLFGNAAAVYGPQDLPAIKELPARNVTGSVTADTLPAAPDAPPENHDIKEPDLFSEPAPEPTDLEAKIIELEEWLNSGLLTKPESVAGIKNLIENPDLEKIDGVLAHLQGHYHGGEK